MVKPVALITGARQGLGRGIALALAKAGFDIAALDVVRDDKCSDLISELTALGANVWFGQMDLADIDCH